MDFKVVIGVVLLLGLFMVSVPFEQQYSPLLTSLVHQPVARFLAAVGVLLVSSIDATLGALAMMVLFFWIADIQLLSSLHVWKRRKDEKTYEK